MLVLLWRLFRGGLSSPKKYFPSALPRSRVGHIYCSLIVSSTVSASCLSLELFKVTSGFHWCAFTVVAFIICQTAKLVSLFRLPRIHISTYKFSFIPPCKKADA